MEWGLFPLFHFIPALTQQEIGSFCTPGGSGISSRHVAGSVARRNNQNRRTNEQDENDCCNEQQLRSQMPDSAASQLLQFRQGEQVRSLTGLLVPVPDNLKLPGQSTQSLPLPVLLWYQKEIFTGRSGTIGPPQALRFQKGNSTPISEMDSVAPVSARRGRARLLDPD